MKIIEIGLKGFKEFDGKGTFNYILSYLYSRFITGETLFQTEPHKKEYLDKKCQAPRR